MYRPTVEPTSIARRRADVDTTVHTIPAAVDAVRSKALMAGITGLVLCAIGLFVSPGNLFRAWLTAYLVFLGIALGSMAMVMIQHLSGGQWGVFRRIFEASAR